MSEAAAISEVAAAAPAAPPEPWRRRVLRALLYGKADRHAKARGRIGLTMIAFTAVYAVIAGRLIVYAMTTDSHIARERANQIDDDSRRFDGKPPSGEPHTENDFPADIDGGAKRGQT